MPNTMDQLIARIENHTTIIEEAPNKRFVQLGELLGWYVKDTSDLIRRLEEVTRDRDALKAENDRLSQVQFVSDRGI